jgi:hypothetical protein
MAETPMDALGFHGKEGVVGSSPTEGLVQVCGDFFELLFAPR